MNFNIINRHAPSNNHLLKNKSYNHSEEKISLSKSPSLATFVENPFKELDQRECTLLILHYLDRLLGCILIFLVNDYGMHLCMPMLLLLLSISASKLALLESLAQEEV